MRVAVTVAVALLLAPAVRAEDIDKSAQADPRGEVVIGNVAGEVQVTGWDRKACFSSRSPVSSRTPPMR